MTERMDVDRLLAAWLAAEAPMREPDGLASRIHGATAGYEPLPAWRALLSTPSMRARSRVVVGSPSLRLAPLAALLVLAVVLTPRLLLSPVGGLPASPVATSTPSPSPSPSSTPQTPIFSTPLQSGSRCAEQPAPDVRPGTFDDVHGRIAYRCGDQLLAVDPARPAEVVSLGPTEADPISWSHDGRRLLLHPTPEQFVVWQDGGWGVGDLPTGFDWDDPAVFVLDADGSWTRPDLPRFRWGTFSPDGSQVAYACCGSDPGPWIGDLAGGAPRSLGAPCDPCGEPSGESAAWSPDGTSIAFIDFTEDSPTHGHHSYDISIMNPDGSDLRELVHLGRGAGGLTWSPDGSRLAFWMLGGDGPEGDGPATIYVVDADGSDLRPVTEHGDDRWPTFSPDGSRLAFARGEQQFLTAPDGSKQAYIHGRQLFTVAVDGTDERPIANIWPDGALAWNPLP